MPHGGGEDTQKLGLVSVEGQDVSLDGYSLLRRGFAANGPSCCCGLTPSSRQTLGKAPGLVLGQPVGMGWSRNPRGAISQRQRQSCHLLLPPLRRLRTRSRAARGPPPGRGSPGPRPRRGEGRMANFTPWCQASSQHAATSSSSFGYSCERISGSKEVNGSGRRERGREKLFP